MSERNLDQWVDAELTRLDRRHRPPWTDARPESERTDTVNTEATARVVLPGNKTGSVPDITITDDTGERMTLWDFTAWAPEEQTLQGAEDLLAQFGWRAANWEGGRKDGRAEWQEASGWWTLRIEAC